MVAELKTNNMARTTGRSGFKMKSSPAKGKLQDFFNTVGSQLKAGQKERGIFSETGRAEKKSRKAGESKFQYDVRTRKARSKDTKAAEVKKKEIKLPKQGPGAPEGSEVTTDVKGRPISTIPLSDDNGAAVVPKTKSRYLNYSGAKGDKYKYRKIQVKSEGGRFHTLTDKENPDDLNPKAFEFQRPGSDVWETSKTAAGTQAIKDVYWDHHLGSERKATFTPINKKSPARRYKKKGGTMASYPSMKRIKK